MTFRGKKTKFVIFGLGRSGSTLLKQLIDSHPDIKCEGELFNPGDHIVESRILRKFMHWFPVPVFSLRTFLFTGPLYGFTLLNYQFARPEKLLKKLQQKGWKIIRIYRKDSLNQSFSNIVAQKTALWHRSKEAETETPKLRIEPDELLFRLNMIVKNKEKETKMFEHIEHLKISYEEDLENKTLWPGTMKRVFEFLETYPVEGKTTLRKTYSKPYAEIVENYDELIKFVESKGF